MLNRPSFHGGSKEWAKEVGKIKAYSMQILLKIRGKFGAFD